MLRHTNTGRVSVLYITHFGGERQRGIVGRVEPQLLDVSQETEQCAHLLAAHRRGQVGDLDDSSPRYPAHCAKLINAWTIFLCDICTIFIYQSPLLGAVYSTSREAEDRKSVV